MGHKVFIPLTDELIFDHPELISAPLRPYDESLACYHWLDVRINPDDEQTVTSHRSVSVSGEDHSRQYPREIAA